MEAVRTADRAAFSHGAALADAFIGSSGLRVLDERRRGRAAALNPSGRFEAYSREGFDDGWHNFEELPPFKTEVQEERPRTIITRNDSPDISFDRSVNPYRGCEHGCIYCFARPSHAYMGLSAGLDFESKLFAKPDAAKLLEREISKPGYEPKTIAIGTNTDPYQPIEKQWRIMREILEVLDAANHPVGIVTKSALVTRDIDILSRMAARGLAKVALSVTTMDRQLARNMEPRAATPTKRLEAMKALSEAGVPVSVMMAPVIPGLNDHEIERILDAARSQGALEAGYVILRLPLEVSPLFKDWLLRHYPDKYRHVLSLVRSMRDGKDYDAEWGKRMRGAGPYAWTIGRRFELAAKRLGMNAQKRLLRHRPVCFTHEGRDPAEFVLSRVSVCSRIRFCESAGVGFEKLLFSPVPWDLRARHFGGAYIWVREHRKRRKPQQMATKADYRADTDFQAGSPPPA